MANCKCKSCGILSKLDAERFDLSYKTFGKPIESEALAAQVPDAPKKRRVNDDRDKLMFNAGRYAGGARDKSAIDANNLLQIVLGGEE